MLIKTRFAPSPTGQLHIGSIRTALYAWLFSRQNNGKFILRIDDSDLIRSSQISVNEIFEVMRWLNLNWDEGPYFQSDRFKRYNNVINSMLVQGKAYKCFCSKERLESVRKMQMDNGDKPKYDGCCRNVNTSRSSNKNGSYVIRFCNPREGKVSFDDQIRGLITFDNRELDDLIICRSNGYPTYNFCVVVDDIDTCITHVVRGEDHINNTPRQINIFKALNASIPKYAHVSMIVNEVGKKISKRHGDYNIIKYKRDGFLPEAVLNYLVRLGWSYGNQEIFDLQQMIKFFNFACVSKSPSIFDTKKLVWLNRYYINNLSINYIASVLQSYMENQGVNINNGPCLIDIVKLYSSRCENLKDMAVSCRYFYQDFRSFDSYSAERYLRYEAMKPLYIIRRKFSLLYLWDYSKINEIIISTVSELKIKKSLLYMSLRVALTGFNESPNLVDIIYIIGKTRLLKRIDIALIYILQIHN